MKNYLFKQNEKEIVNDLTILDLEQIYDNCKRSLIINDGYIIGWETNV